MQEPDFVSMRGHLRELARHAKGSLRTTRYDTSDLAQDAFLQVWKGIINETGLGDQLMAGKLLKLIVRRQSAKLRRFHTADKRSPRKEDLWVESQHPREDDPALHAENLELVSQMKKQLSTMDPLKKQIIFRRAIANLSWNEIATELGKCRFWVKRQYDAGIALLRNSVHQAL